MASGVSAISIVVGARNQTQQGFAQVVAGHAAMVNAIGAQNKRLTNGGGIVPGSNQQAFSQRQILGPLQQLSFGLEDFLTVFGTSGFAGGMRAAANNISMAASIINPWFGIWAGIGASTIPIIFQKIMEGADSSEEALKRVEQAVKNLKAQMDDAANINVSRRNAVALFADAEDSPEDQIKAADSAFRSAQEDIDDAKARQAPLEGRSRVMKTWMADIINKNFKPHMFSDGEGGELFAGLVDQFNAAQNPEERTAAFKKMEAMFDKDGVVSEETMTQIEEEAKKLVEEYKALADEVRNAERVQADTTAAMDAAMSDPSFQAKIDAEQQAKAAEMAEAWRKQQRDALGQDLKDVAGSKNVGTAEREIDLIGQAFAADMDDLFRRYAGDDGAMSADEKQRYQYAAQAAADRMRADLSSVSDRFGDMDRFKGTLGAGIDPRTAAGVSYLNRLAAGRPGQEDAARIQEKANAELRKIEKNTRDKGVKVTVKDIT